MCNNIAYAIVLIIIQCPVCAFMALDFRVNDLVNRIIHPEMVISCEISFSEN